MKPTIVLHMQQKILNNDQITTILKDLTKYK
jgi:hypothetical protein